MSHDALERLCRSLNCAEARGDMPSAQRSIVIAMLSRPTGGRGGASHRLLPQFVPWLGEGASEDRSTLPKQSRGPSCSSRGQAWHRKCALSRFSRNDTRWSHTRTFGSMPSRCIFHSDSVPSVAAEDPSWRGLPTVSKSRHRGRATTELRACYRPSRWHMTLRFPSVHIAMFVDDVWFRPNKRTGRCGRQRRLLRLLTPSLQMACNWHWLMRRRW